MGARRRRAPLGGADAEVRREGGHLALHSGCFVHPPHAPFLHYHWRFSLFFPPHRCTLMHHRASMIRTETTPAPVIHILKGPSDQVRDALDALPREGSQTVSNCAASTMDPSKGLTQAPGGRGGASRSAWVGDRGGGCSAVSSGPRRALLHSHTPAEVRGRPADQWLPSICFPNE